MVKKKWNKESGAQMIEYAIAAAILIGVFIMAGVLIEDSGKDRGDASMDIHKDAVTCGTDLSGDECL